MVRKGKGAVADGPFGICSDGLVFYGGYICCFDGPFGERRGAKGGEKEYLKRN